MLSLLNVRSPWHRLPDYSMSLCNTLPLLHFPRGIVSQRIYVLERENPPSRGSTRNACARGILFHGLVSLMSWLGCTERIKAHVSTSTLCRPRSSYGKDILWPEFKTTQSFSLHKPYIVKWARIVCILYGLLWLWSYPLNICPLVMKGTWSSRLLCIFLWKLTSNLSLSFSLSAHMLSSLWPLLDQHISELTTPRRQIPAGNRRKIMTGQDHERSNFRDK